MPSKASMLAQIAHAARTSMLVRIAHAARTAAAATCRFARLAERAALSPEAVAALSPEARAGAGDLLLHRSSAVPPPHALAAPSPGMDASFAFPTHYLKDKFVGSNKNMVEFVVQEEDLKSDEALWALYERWCKAFNQKRDHDEMVSLFNEFKDTVLRRHRNHVQMKPSLPFKLSKYADGKLMKMRANRDGHEAMLAKKAGNSSVLWKLDGSFLREVFAEFRVVDGKLFVFTPAGEKVELTTKYEVVAGKLFADLPEENELVIQNDEFMLRRYCMNMY